jgi:hypothetical protein
MAYDADLGYDPNTVQLPEETDECGVCGAPGVSNPKNCGFCGGGE